MFNAHPSSQHTLATIMATAIGAIMDFSEKSSLRSLCMRGLLQSPRIIHAECFPPDTEGFSCSTTDTGFRSNPL